MAGEVVAGIAGVIMNCALLAPADQHPELWPIKALEQVILTESGGNPAAIHVNTTGSLKGSVDYGLGQINSTNLPWLHETPTSIMEPCRNIAASARILTSFSLYNTGSPVAGISNGYALKVLAQRAPDGLSAPPPSPPPNSPTPKPTDQWNVFAPAAGQKFVFSQKDH